MSENTNEVMTEVENKVEEDILIPEVSSEPIVPEQKIVLPTTTAFGQAMVNTATTMVAGAIIGAGLNALAAGANKALRSGAKWAKKKIEEKKEAKALKKAEEQALKELAEEVTPDESTN
jgi:hypothetical protein